MIKLQVQELSVLNNLSLRSKYCIGKGLPMGQASAGHSIQNNLIIGIIVTRIVQSDVIDRSVDCSLHPLTLLALGEDIKRTSYEVETGLVFSKRAIVRLSYTNAR